MSGKYDYTHINAFVKYDVCGDLKWWGGMEGYYIPHPLCPPLLTRLAAGEGEDIKRGASAPLEHPVGEMAGEILTGQWQFDARAAWVRIDNL